MRRAENMRRETKEEKSIEKNLKLKREEERERQKSITVPPEQELEQSVSEGGEPLTLFIALIDACISLFLFVFATKLVSVLLKEAI